MYTCVFPGQGSQGEEVSDRGTQGAGHARVPGTGTEAPPDWFRASAEVLQRARGDRQAREGTLPRGRKSHRDDPHEALNPFHCVEDRLGNCLETE